MLHLFKVTIRQDQGEVVRVRDGLVDWNDSDHEGRKKIFLVQIFCQYKYICLKTIYFKQL